ncbi:MAG: PolC-type DNA polymerase III [Ruminococcaceae bacterium]|nr:PolC-type DNA polymerase III [Oscillospiraceae bacterium]
MSRKTPFAWIFREFRPEGALGEVCDKLFVKDIQGDRASREMTVEACSDELVLRADVETIEQEICKAYGLAAFHIKLQYPPEMLDDAYLENVCSRIREKHPVASSFLEDAVFEPNFEKGTLTIRLASGGAEYLQNAGFNRDIERTVFSEFGIRVKVQFEGVLSQDAQAVQQSLDEMKNNLGDAPAPAPAQEKKPARPRSEGRPGGESGSSHRRKSMVIGEKDELIFGKPQEAEITSIKELDLHFVTATIKGEVFAINHREIPARELTIISFDVTDLKSSIRVSRAMQMEKAAPIVEAIHEGDCLIIQGQPVFNNFEGEMTFNPSAIVRTTKSKRKDTAEVKRVELHCHTNMSAMDGMAPVEALVKRAAEWGHAALAITDHGCAQAFPFGAKQAGKLKKDKGLDLQLIYGVEGYDINDSPDTQVVFGAEKDCSFDDSFCVFDLETTGLSAEREVITQIAAVIVEKGEVTQEFSTFVNPERPIPPKIVELTGITDAMVADAPSIEEGVRAFLEFAGDRVMVAHNANFDAGFLRAACARYGIEDTFTFLDTLELSRALMPELPKYNLKAVYQELVGGSFRHHRADEDAGVLGEILIKLLERLDGMGIHNLADINEGLRSKLGEAALNSTNYGHIIILVRNLTGLRNLYELISLSQLKYFKRRPRIPRSELNRLREGLLVGSACEQGELFQAVMKKKPWATLVKMAKYFDYLEIQPIGNNEFMLRNGMVSSVEELREFNRTIVKLGKAADRPVVATGDVHFLDPTDAQFRAILMAGQGFSDADEQAPLYFKTTDEMLEEFSYLGQDKAYEVVVENPNKIAQMCERIRPVPDGAFPPSIEGSAEELQNIVYTKARELYGEELPAVISDRIEAELRPIINNGFDVMYMIAQKLIAQSVASGYLVGSRGSVGSSVVAYFAGITEVNAYPPHYRCPNCKHSDFDVPKGYSFGIDMPDAVCPKCGTKYEKDGCDIMFATFLGFNADKQPDIDLNFSGEYQARAHRHTIELFGEDHVFRAGTIGTLAEKTAFGFVKKYLEERNISVPMAEINRLSIGCTGVRRTTGQHPGGLIVVPQDKSIYDFCPVQHPADDPDSDIITTHFEFHCIDENLLKLDLLGHDDPSMIRMLEDLTGVDMIHIPFDDPDTMSIFLSSKILGYENDPLIGPMGTVAIPEFGTKFVRGMLEDTTPKTFAGLVRISGLSHGTDVWLGNAQKIIKEGLADLEGVICCRDDITAYLISCGIPPKDSFKISETCRKGKAATIAEETWNMLREHGVPEWYITSCNTVKYLFPRAHATAYVMMAFRIAWCKVHRPLAFYAAYFTIRAKAFDPIVSAKGIDAIRDRYHDIEGRIDRGEPVSAVEKEAMNTLEVCYEMCLRGMSFLPVDVYKSDAVKFVMEDETHLRIPFTALSGLGEAPAADLMAERAKGPFSSIEDVSIRCPKVSKSIIAMLEEVGAFADLPKSDQLSIFDF